MNTLLDSDPTTVRNALARISKAALAAEDTLESELCKELELLSWRYHLNVEESIVVSVLFTKTTASEDMLVSAMKDYNVDADYLFLEHLERQGIIIDPGKKGQYRLTTQAKRSLMQGEPFNNPPITDCMRFLKELNDMPLYIYEKGDWFSAFKRGFRFSGNEVFLQADKILELSELPTESQIAFWLLANFFIKHFTTVNDKEKPVGGFDEKHFIPLVKKGLVNILPQKGEAGDEVLGYILSTRSVKTLFSGMDDIVRYDQLSKYATIVPFSEITQVELFFSPGVAREIDSLRKVLSQEGYVRATAILERKKRNPAIQSLLWGPPGTGKTEVVRQLARESGRDLIMVDSARLTNSNWGDTEKAYRDFFTAYAYTEAVLNQNVPILFMNEADSILSKRLSFIERSIDKSENAVTDILLQEFESMNGIVLITTNFTDSIDAAFDRRFLFKTELGYPDEKSREHIWKNKIPELSDLEAHELASAYTFSGAQIQNVVVKRDLAELYYDGDRGLSYIRSLCVEELKLSAAKKGKRIGF